MSFQIICKKCSKESTLTNKNAMEFPIEVENVEVNVDVEGDACCGMYVSVKLKCTNCNEEIITKDSFD